MVINRFKIALCLTQVTANDTLFKVLITFFENDADSVVHQVNHKSHSYNLFQKIGQKFIFQMQQVVGNHFFLPKNESSFENLGSNVSHSERIAL